MKLLHILFLFIFYLMKTTRSNDCSLPEYHRVVNNIPDCNCKHATVQHAVSNFLSPLLSNIVSSKFFRYFFVELDRPCPYWKENGLCMMEGCSVCTCPKEEIPKAWIQSTPSSSSTSPSKTIEREDDFGWISNASSSFGFDGLGHDQTLGRIEFSSNKPRNNGGYSYLTISSDQKHSSYFQTLFQTEDCENFNEWTELAAPLSEVGVYVNLLDNPERFTGYAGPPAHRVWRAIKEENCFGSGIEELCLEKRIFYRLMSGLQASISTHIARQYLHPTGDWGVNLPLYWNAVGNHPDRVDNLYLAFLFLLRATMKARHVLLHYPYETGNTTDDLQVKQLMTRLLTNDQFTTSSSSSLERDFSPVLHGYSSASSSLVSTAVEECSYGFNEQNLFQVSEEVSGPQYWQQLEEKHQLREEFRLKFRNISRILDCVTCEKCRLWGKLQILGFGTAIKILLSNEDDLVIRQSFDLNPSYRQGASLNRQEVIALVNTLNQFAKSVEFTAFAERERDNKDRADPLVVIPEATEIAITGEEEVITERDEPSPSGLVVTEPSSGTSTPEEVNSSTAPLREEIRGPAPALSGLPVTIVFVGVCCLLPLLYFFYSK